MGKIFQFGMVMIKKIMLFFYYYVYHPILYMYTDLQDNEPEKIAFLNRMEIINT